MHPRGRPGRDGKLRITDGNAYSGNNGRSAIKGSSGAYYLAGNDNNGGLSKTQLLTTQVGLYLINSTGAEFLIPGQTPPVPPSIDKIGDFEITQLGYTTADKAGKDNNFRGITIYNNTLYITKGSGGNGIIKGKNRSDFNLENHLYRIVKMSEKKDIEKRSPGSATLGSMVGGAGIETT